MSLRNAALHGECSIRLLTMALKRTVRDTHWRDAHGARDYTRKRAPIPCTATCGRFLNLTLLTCLSSNVFKHTKIS